MNNGVDISEEIQDSAILTQYAVTARYPDDYVEVNEEDYKEAVSIAETVYIWVKEQVS